jgi:hypothetical protein
MAVAEKIGRGCHHLRDMIVFLFQVAALKPCHGRAPRRKNVRGFEDIGKCL